MNNDHFVTVGIAIELEPVQVANFPQPSALALTR